MSRNEAILLHVIRFKYLDNNTRSIIKEKEYLLSLYNDEIFNQLEIIIMSYVLELNQFLKPFHFGIYISSERNMFIAKISLDH